MENKANITETQYQKWLTYLEEARSKHMNMMYFCIGGSVLLAIPGILLLSGYSGNMYSTLAGAAWFGCLIGTAILFFTGYQRKFGNNSVIARAKRREFSCEYITVSQLSGSEGRPPYLVNDSLGQQYICPVYLEFKALKQGGQAIGILMDGSERFAVHDASHDELY